MTAAWLDTVVLILAGHAIGTGLSAGIPEDVLREFYRGNEEAVHGPGSWEANPVVCVVTFAIESVIASAAREAA